MARELISIEGDNSDVIYEQTDKYLLAIQEIRETVKALRDPEEVHEIRRRADIIKAWAKTYKQTKHLRRELFELEVTSLVQLHKLGATEGLTKKEREAAEALAELSEADLGMWIEEAGNISTATGLHTFITKSEHREQLLSKWSARFKKGILDPWTVTEDEVEQAANTYSTTIKATLASVIAEYAINDQPFTVSEAAATIASEVMNSYRWSYYGHMPDDADHAVIRSALADVTRKSILAYPAGKWSGTDYPAFITSVIRVDEFSEPTFIRIPTPAAKVRDLATMIRFREKQVADFVASLNELKDFHAELIEIPGVNEETIIGSVLDGVQEVAA